jgi:hypothetical protein
LNLLGGSLARAAFAKHGFSTVERPAADERDVLVGRTSS